MDFTLPPHIVENATRFDAFLGEHVRPHLADWMRRGEIPRGLFPRLGSNGWLGFAPQEGTWSERSHLEQAVLFEHLARLSPGVGVAVLVQISLGMKGLLLFGSEALKSEFRDRAIQGETLLCLGNTESGAGSDSAAIRTAARRVEGGWLLSGAKAFVTNGSIADLAVVTAVTDGEAPRNRRSSLFLVDLSARGVHRTKLDKRVWVPSDLTRLAFEDVFVPRDRLLGTEGRGLAQVLRIFTQSRVQIAALTVGTAQGALDLALKRGDTRRLFGTKLMGFQAKAFEAADHFAGLDAARLALWRACWALDRGGEARLESSVAKYLAVEVARRLCPWAADLFGASSVVFDHPIHKFPMDAWASSLGEGTQDVQKLLIFRELWEKRNLSEA